MERVTRRRFATGLALAGLGGVLAACGQASPPPTTDTQGAPSAAPKPTAPPTKPAEATKPTEAQPAKPPGPAATAAAAPQPAAAPAASGGQVRNLTYFPGPDDVKSVNRRMKWFEDEGFYQQHPNIKIEWVVLNGPDEFWQKMLTSTAAGTPPDLAKAKEAYVFELASRNGLAALDSYVKQSGLSPTSFAQAGWDAFLYKGALYALPLEPLIMSLWMNDELYQKAGLTGADGHPKAPADWAEWREQNKTLQQKSVPPGGFAFQYYEYTTREFNLMLFNMWLVMAGGKFWLDDDRTKLGVNGPEGLKALQFQLDMIYQDKTSQPPSTEASSDARYRPQYAGQIANWIQGMWAKPSFDTNAPKLKYSLALIPKDVRYAHPAQASGNAIPKASKMIDDAWTVVRWFAEPKQDLSYRQVMPSLPVLKESLTAEAFTKDPYLAFFGQIWARPDNVVRPLAEGWDEMAVAMATEIQAAYFKQKGPQEALDAAKDTGERIAAKARTKSQ